MDLSTRLNELAAFIDEEMKNRLPATDPDSRVLFDAMRYSAEAGGKRIRPVLALLFSRLFGGKDEDVLPFACAIEMVHTYSLIHDDLPCMDDDDYRRGKLTNHKVFGDGMAMLAGDGLLSSAYEVMTKDMLLYLDDPEKLNRRVRAIYELSKGTGVRGMVAGQVADLESEHKDVSPDMLAFIHMNKTAAFIKSSVMAGAYIGGADSDALRRFSVYGESLGLAFQIIDDIQDVIGTKESRGKDVGGDAEAEKATYPALFGIEKSKEYAQELLDKARNAIDFFKGKAESLFFVIDYLEQQIKD